MENVQILEACKGYMAADQLLAAVISLYKEDATVTWHKFKVSLMSLSARVLGLMALASLSGGPIMKRVESLKYILMHTSCMGTNNLPV